jgi:hypothetical protein
MNQRIQNAIATGTEWLGADHPAVECLRCGVALHHGGLPRPFLNEIERLLRSGDCPVTIASPTLAQGLNLSASILLVPSIWRIGEIISATEFANVAGRAGRAFVDMEGLVLHVIWENDPSEELRALRNWEQLVSAARAPSVASGLLLLAIKIYTRIAQVAGVSLGNVVDYITGNANAWDFDSYSLDNLEISDTEWDRDIASLDSAILVLLDAETADDDIEPALEHVLEGSLFARQLAQKEEIVQSLLRGFIAARTHRIWSQTRVMQRKGYHAAAIGLNAGLFLDSNLTTLVDLLIRAETAIAEGDAAIAAQMVIEFAELVFRVTPFRAMSTMPSRWKDALQAWIEGRPAVDVMCICESGGVDLIQQAFAYGLPWAMEAVRVHASAVGQEGSEQIQGLAALAVESGSTDPSVITLLRNGLNSREAAIVAVKTTGSSFVDRDGMLIWLGSDYIKERSAEDDWPTEQSRHSWLQFYERRTNNYRQKWIRETQQLRVEWFGDAPNSGSHVVIEPNANLTGSLVLSPDFVQLGVIKSILRMSRRFIMDARVSDKPEAIIVEYFGPPLSRKLRKLLIDE